MNGFWSPVLVALTLLVGSVTAGGVYAVTEGPSAATAEEQSPAATADERPVRFDYLVRPDFFAGVAGDRARLDRAMKLCEEILARDPRHAEAMVWHGAGLVILAGQKFRDGDGSGASEMLTRGLKEMDDAAGLAPDAIGVLIPRAATLSRLARALPADDRSRALIAQSVAGYERALAIQSPYFERLSAHARGELLGGAAEGWSRLGDLSKARPYLERMVAELSDSPYGERARTWLGASRSIEERHGSAGALPSAGGLGGPSRPPMSLEKPGERGDRPALSCIGCHTGPAASSDARNAVYDYTEIRSVDYSKLPEPRPITARDGTLLATRVYDGDANAVIVALHGSSGNGRYFHPMAQYLSERKKAAVYIPDLRGHGDSGGRPGDVDYVGQLEDDLDDVLAAVRKERPGARILLLGHSAGGGLVVRYAGRSRDPGVDGYILLAPYLGPTAPTTKPDSGGWARADVPKIVELAERAARGDTSGQDRIVLRFVKPESMRTGREVLAYSFRMVMSYNPRLDLKDDLSGIRKPLLVLVGDKDESFHPGQFEPTIAPHAKGTFKVLPGVTHLGLVVNPRTAEEIAAWLPTR